MMRDRTSRRKGERGGDVKEDGGRKERNGSSHVRARKAAARSLLVPRPTAASDRLPSSFRPLRRHALPIIGHTCLRLPICVRDTAAIHNRHENLPPLFVRTFTLFPRHRNSPYLAYPPVDYGIAPTCYCSLLDLDALLPYLSLHVPHLCSLLGLQHKPVPVATL